MTRISSRVVWRHAAVLVAVLAAPAAIVFAEASPAASLQPPGWDAGIRLREARDLNADAHVVEINLEARLETVEVAPGQKVEAWTYDGGIPGPLIRVTV